MWQDKPIQFIIKLFTDHHTLFVKHATHQKVESLKAAFLSKLGSTINNNSISNIKYAELFTKSKVLLHFVNPACAYNHPYNLHQKSFPLLQSTFTSLFPCFLTKSYLQSTLTLPSSIPQHFLTSLFLHATIPTSYTKNVFPTSATYPIHAASKDKGAMESCEDL